MGLCRRDTAELDLTRSHADMVARVLQSLTGYYLFGGSVMFTVGSMVYLVSLEIVKFAAECANLELLTYAETCDPQYEGKTSGFANHGQYWSFEDSATAGGGCRITWSKNVAWVSRHSGYGWADCTQEVCDLLEELGAKHAKQVSFRNPRVYGTVRGF